MTPFKDLRNDGAYFNDLLERPKYNAIPQPDLLQELRPLQQLQSQLCRRHSIGWTPLQRPTQV